MKEAMLAAGLDTLATAMSDCHPLRGGAITDDQVKSVLFHEETRDPGGWAEGGSMAILALTDGRFALAREDSDSSGHG